MKTYLYIALALALAFIGGWLYIDRLQEKAARVDAAEAAVEAERKGRADDMREVVRRLDDDAKGRAELAARMGGIEARFNDLKIPEPGKLILTKEVPGACPSVGASPEFVSVFNGASEP